MSDTIRGPFGVSVDTYGNVSWDTGDCEVRAIDDLRLQIIALSALADVAEKRAAEKAWLS